MKTCTKKFGEGWPIKRMCCSSIGAKLPASSVTHHVVRSGKEEPRMVSPEALKLNEILRNAPKAVDMDLPHQREAGEHAEDMTSEPECVTYEDAPEVGGLWATPQDWDGESAIVYLYGGGYIISSPHSRRKLAGHLANASSARALVPRYHLAPERSFPSAVEDAAADYRWLLGEGGRPERTVVVGDSSAGGLAVATMLKLREDGQPLPAGGVPISPWADLACTGETLETNAAVDLTATKASLQLMAGQYLQGADPHTPLAPLCRPLRFAGPAHRGGRRRGATRRFGAPRTRRRDGGRGHHLVHRGWHAAHLPDLLRRDARGRRGGGHDRNMDPLPHLLSARGPNPRTLSAESLTTQP
jgi:monoterpene epsilon-lactone hydrolase